MTIVPLSDPRLVAIVAGSLDDSGTPSAAEFPPTSSGLSLRRDGDIALFKTGELADGTPIEVAVRIEGAVAVFFPNDRVPIGSFWLRWESMSESRNGTVCR